MTVRLHATVPDYVARAIERLALKQGRENSNATALLLEKAVNDGLESGLIPTETSTEDQLATLLLETAVRDGLVERLVSLDKIPADVLTDVKRIADSEGKGIEEIKIDLLRKAIAQRKIDR